VAMEQTFRVYLNSAASEQTFPENTAASFTQVLPERISLDPPGEWYCRLTSCELGFKVIKPYYLLCDCCTESIAGEWKKPVLALLFRKFHEFTNLPWVGVKKRELSTVKIWVERVVQTSGSKKPVAGTCHCALEFKRIISAR
jgi:hypothetical protein